MKSFLPLHRETNYISVAWYESRHLEQVSFAVRRPSLAQRIELTDRARNLSLKYEFLAAGGAADQLEASLSELLVRRLYLEWGLVDIKGLKIDGGPATVARLIERGPEELTDEIISAIKAESGLSDEERKNS